MTDHLETEDRGLVFQIVWNQVLLGALSMERDCPGQCGRKFYLESSLEPLSAPS